MHCHAYTEQQTSKQRNIINVLPRVIWRRTLELFPDRYYPEVEIQKNQRIPECSFMPIIPDWETSRLGLDIDGNSTSTYRSPDAQPTVFGIPGNH